MKTKLPLVFCKDGRYSLSYEVENLNNLCGISLYQEQSFMRLHPFTAADIDEYPTTDAKVLEEINKKLRVMYPTSSRIATQTDILNVECFCIDLCTTMGILKDCGVLGLPNLEYVINPLMEHPELVSGYWQSSYHPSFMESHGGWIHIDCVLKKCGGVLIFSDYPENNAPRLFKPKG